MQMEKRAVGAGLGKNSFSGRGGRVTQALSPNCPPPPSKGAPVTDPIFCPPKAPPPPPPEKTLTPSYPPALPSYPLL